MRVEHLVRPAGVSLDAGGCGIAERNPSRCAGLRPPTYCSAISQQADEDRPGFPSREALAHEEQDPFAEVEDFPESGDRSLHATRRCRRCRPRERPPNGGAYPTSPPGFALSPQSEILEQQEARSCHQADVLVAVARDAYIDAPDGDPERGSTSPGTKGQSAAGVRLKSTARGFARHLRRKGPQE